MLKILRVILHRGARGALARQCPHVHFYQAKEDSHCFSVDDIHLQSSVKADLLLQLAMLLATSSFTTKVRTRDFIFFKQILCLFRLKIWENSGFGLFKCNNSTNFANFRERFARFSILKKFKSPNYDTRICCHIISKIKTKLSTHVSC